ncbi:hypothetical protein ACXOXS_01190 [Streptococcus thermophilus]|nr:hypothetical protein [Streptococcus thermophilus]
MTETEVKLKLFEEYESIHGPVYSEEHKQKMMDELDTYSFISKMNELMYKAKNPIQVFSVQ